MSQKDFTVRLHTIVENAYATEDKIVKSLDEAVATIKGAVCQSYQVFDEVGTLVMSGFGNVAAKVEAAVEEVKEAVVEISEKVEAVATEVAESAEDVAEKVEEAVAEVKEAVAEVIEAVKTTKKKK